MHTYATSNLTWYFHGRFRTFPTALFDHSFVSASSSLELEPGEICSLETWKHNETYIQKARICFHQVWPSMGTSSVKVWGGSWEQTTVWVQNQFGFGSELKHVLNAKQLLKDQWLIHVRSFSLTRELCQNMAAFSGGFLGLSAKRSRSKWRLSARDPLVRPREFRRIYPSHSKRQTAEFCTSNYHKSVIWHGRGSRVWQCLA